jgi:hypothetical protein
MHCVEKAPVHKLNIMREAHPICNSIQQVRHKRVIWNANDCFGLSHALWRRRARRQLPSFFLTGA